MDGFEWKIDEQKFRTKKFDLICRWLHCSEVYEPPLFLLDPPVWLRVYGSRRCSNREICWLKSLEWHPCLHWQPHAPEARIKFRNCLIWQGRVRHLPNNVNRCHLGPEACQKFGHKTKARRVCYRPNCFTWARKFKVWTSNSKLQTKSFDLDVAPKLSKFKVNKLVTWSW